MHVLFIPSWYPTHRGDIGGSFFREQAIALRKYGCQVGVIYPQLRSLRNFCDALNGKRVIEKENDHGVMTMRSHGTNWFPLIPSGLKSLWISHGLSLFEEYVKEHGVPSIIHAHSILYAGVVAREIKLRYGIPFVITEHSSAFNRGLVSRANLLLAQDVAEQAAERFSVSPIFSDFLRKSLSEGRLNWGVIPNAVSQQFIDRKIKKSKAQKEFTFINIALLNENKRQSNLIKAFSASFSKDLNVNLIIGGDGPERIKLRKLSISLGVENRVKFTGMLSRRQVLEKIEASDAFVLPSRHETFGVVLIESLALGKPVIATRCGGPESIVREQDGILVPVDDIDSLGKAMRYLYENHSNFDSAEIRAACIYRYSESAVVSQLCREYLRSTKNQPSAGNPSPKPQQTHKGPQ